MNSTMKKPMAPASHPEPQSQELRLVTEPAAPLSTGTTLAQQPESQQTRTQQPNACQRSINSSETEPDAPARLHNLAPAFRDAMAELAGGVCVITTLDQEQPTGLTVTSGFSVSMTPALFAICVDNRSRSLNALLKTERFVANILDGQSSHVAGNFASSKVPDKFMSPTGPIDSATTRTGLPWLCNNSQAGVECEIEKTVPAGDHTLIIGRVIDVLFPATQSPSGGLAYLKREFHGLRSTT